jgi:GTP pyrophosphokinase
VLDFPRGATPIDFAYRVHTEVGHHCKGAKVNGKIVPLKYKLQNGDTIEIITDPTSHPSKDWLKIAVTSKAKSKIRGITKKEERETGRAIGKEILSKELRKYGESYEKLHGEGAFKNAAMALGYSNFDDLLLAIGYGKTSPHELVGQIVSPDKMTELREKEPNLFQSFASRILPHKKDGAIKVGGMDDVMVRYGKCCDPLPGDTILDCAQDELLQGA